MGEDTKGTTTKCNEGGAIEKVSHFRRFLAQVCVIVRDPRIRKKNQWPFLS